MNYVFKVHFRYSELVGRVNEMVFTYWETTVPVIEMIYDNDLVYKTVLNFGSWKLC